MKISFDWLNLYLKIGLSPVETAELLTHCGLEVESITEYETVKGGLKGLIVGEVIEKSKHPNADKLSICKVRVGEDRVSQIVCGASNVEAGQKVIVALPGTILNPLKGEPFQIKKSKIRGEISEGMICAEDEIGLGPAHEGIMVLDPDAKTGMSAAGYFQLKSDVVFEIGLTPNRGDAASHLGVARDLAAVIRNRNPKISHPDVTVAFPEVNLSCSPGQSPVSVTVENTTDCIRYSGIYISNVKVEESPAWIRHRLLSIGLKPLNNIVDITNFVLHEYGQPLHAFDADKISGSHVIVKNLSAGTSFITLDGVERRLNGSELMICDTNGGMCIAGVFGGLNSGITSETKNVFIESACFSPSSIRKTSKHHSLKTDASFRFERGTDPEITVEAMLRAASLIAEWCGGTVHPYYTDVYPVPAKQPVLSFRLSDIIRLTGTPIPESSVKGILTDLGFQILKQDGESLHIAVPAFKHDIRTVADLAEEVLRIYGYGNVPVPDKMNLPLPEHTFNEPEILMEKISSFLVADGFTELINNSLVPAGEQPSQVKIINPISRELAAMRFTMLTTGLETISYNLNRKNNRLRLFEAGAIYSCENGKFNERQCIALFIAGNRHEESWIKTEQQPPDFYTLKSVILRMLEQAGLSAGQITFRADSNENFHLCASIHCGTQRLGYAGYAAQQWLKQFDLHIPVLAAELYRDAILQSLTQTKKIAEPPLFPVVRRDLAMILADSVIYSDIEKIAFSIEPKLIRRMNLFDVYKDDSIGKGKKSLAVSFYLQDDEKTLTDKQIDSVMDKLIGAFTAQLGAEIRK